MRRICILLAAVVLLLMPASCDFRKPDAPTTTPEQTTAEITTPESTTSEQTTPEVTTPEDTTPEETTPAVTEPDFSNTPDPDGTKRY